MKTIIIVTMLLFGGKALHAQVPTWKEWFKQKKTQQKYLLKQIALLKVYAGYAKKGYEIASTGLKVISDIRAGTFSLDKEYIESLKRVGQVVRHSPRVTSITLLQYKIIRDFRKLYDEAQATEYLTEKEVKYIEQCYQSMLKQCNEAMDELELLTVNGKATMNDEERLERLEKLYEEMLGKYKFTQYFSNSVRLLVTQRAQEATAASRSLQLHHEL